VLVLSAFEDYGVVVFLVSLVVVAVVCVTHTFCDLNQSEHLDFDFL
jgi:hypothetical protein